MTRPQGSKGGLVTDGERAEVIRLHGQGKGRNAILARSRWASIRTGGSTCSGSYGRAGRLGIALAMGQGGGTLSGAGSGRSWAPLRPDPASTAGLAPRKRAGTLRELRAGDVAASRKRGDDAVGCPHDVFPGHLPGHSRICAS